ncbi:MAG: phytoene/squalene synthase family protein [Rubricoccaceae bacterium]|nr:phytoene/squalene synthase family protein [Rubricoccaceae bacterium]
MSNAISRTPSPFGDLPRLPLGASRIEQDRYLQQVFGYHSRTFSLATRLLPQNVRLPIATLYVFCRTIDGLADEYVLDASAEQAREEVERIRICLKQSLRGHPPDELLWKRLSEIHEQFSLPVEAMNELLDGALWDINNQPIHSTGDLLEYADHVAGSVGAMMLPFLVDERSNQAELTPSARALGQAMQLTNIVRDVGEDWRQLGRIYIPHEVMHSAGLTADDLSDVAMSDVKLEGYIEVLETIMELADALYEEAKPGLEALPLNVRRGIGAAARMYREIQNEVRAAGYDNLRHRAVVPFARRARLIAHDDYQKRKEYLLSTRVSYDRFPAASAA